MILLSLLACVPSKPPPRLVAQLPVAEEVPIQELLLEGPAADAVMEFSGLAWLSEGVLALLPQFPTCGPEHDRACVYVLDAEDIVAALESGEALTPAELALDLGDLPDTIPGYQGTEALVVNGSHAWLSIEAEVIGEVSAWLVPARLDNSALRADAERALQILPAVQITNESVETLFYWGAQVCGIDEANGAEHNPEPRAQCFDADLEPTREPSMAALDYRVTDATQPDADGRIWVTNYQYSGSARGQPAIDPLMERFGVGPTHAETRTVERLVELQLTETGLEHSGAAPIVLELEEGVDRNWEGVVRFGEGFLIVTDKFPDTVLAYVEAP